MLQLLTIKTPPIIDGCLKGVLRKQVIDIVELLPEYNLEEASISQASHNGRFSVNPDNQDNQDISNPKQSHYTKEIKAELLSAKAPNALTYKFETWSRVARIVYEIFCIILSGTDSP